ncbi:MAG: HEAT repeat domain-containing protein [Deltaproteobacteria bacterium]|nr:MAG: HEAT repeat domain-containing protein [Deltaproteobacteria bacterium]
MGFAAGGTAMKRTPERLLTMLQASPLFTAELLSRQPPESGPTEAEAAESARISALAKQRMGRVGAMREAIRELGELRHEPAVDVLVALAVHSVIDEVRAEAVDALLAIGVGPGRNAVVDALDRRVGERWRGMAEWSTLAE